MKQRKIYGDITAVLAVLLLVVLLLDLTGVSSWANLFKDGSLSVPEAYAEQITTYDNGDFVYSYTEEHIAMDVDESVIYVDDLVDVFLTEEVSKSEKQKLAAQVNGTIVTDISGIINMMQILVDAEDYDEICQYAEILNENETVRSATYDVPYFMEDAYTDTNPWSSVVSYIPGAGAYLLEGDENDPDGANWYAEAIGAYTAWSYEDYCTSDVAVGVIDTTVQTSHEDLSVCTQLENSSDSAQDHGTMVAGIISADDNEIGLRGIASSSNYNLSVYCIDRTKLNITRASGSGTYFLDSTSGTFAEWIKLLLEKDVKVINMSFGITVYTEENYKSLRGSEDGAYMTLFNSNIDYDEYLETLEIISNHISKMCISMMISLLDAGQDFLIVQAAGNGWNNGNDGHDSCYCTGFFCGIQIDLYTEETIDYYQEIEEHILIVGAVENSKHDGDYLMTSYSNYGKQVDICAPGNDIFALTTTGYETKDRGGTSAAAPMVTGAAALLWSIEPSLTASDVRLYLLSSAKTSAISSASVDAEYTYPMLNVGAAVEALLEDRSNLGSYSGMVYDSLTNDPIEGATVTISSIPEEQAEADSFLEQLWDDLTDTIKSLWSWDGAWSAADVAVSATTNEGGLFLIDVDAGITAGEYSLTCEADGYYTYSETITVEPSGDSSYSVFYPEAIYMVPLDEESDTLQDQDNETANEAENTPSDPLESQIASLVDEYGVINTGSETYDVNFTTNKHSEAFSSQRITGLLCADIYDYDSDGTNELMVLRVDPGSFAAGDLDFASTNLIVSVYEPSDTEAVLADEKEMTLYCGVAWAYASNAFSLFRYASSLGDDYQPADEVYPVWLALDYLYYENTSSKLSYGIVALAYDEETLSLADGIESNEEPAENYVNMYVAKNDKALTNLTGRIARNGYTGWCNEGEDNGDGFYEYDFQSSASGVFADYVEYRDIHYDLLLMRFGLLEETFRSNYGDMDFSSVSGLTEIIGLSPSELYRSNANTSDGITNLCSIQTPWFQGGVTLTCEDNTGLLDGYRY